MRGFVHCNLGWSDVGKKINDIYYVNGTEAHNTFLKHNGYYHSGIFDINNGYVVDNKFGPYETGSGRESNSIINTNGSIENYYQYALKIIPNIRPNK